jgi:hypothetical protein
MSGLSPDVARAGFRLAILIVLIALGLLVTLSPGTPEFAITVLTLLIGVTFVGVIVVLVRWVGR